MNDSYEHLRTNLNAGTQVMPAFFIGLATGHDGMTAAAVTMAALDIPIDRAAQLLLRTPSELDALITLFREATRRSLASERARRGSDAT